MSQNVSIIKILLKSGACITTAVCGLKTLQKPDRSGYSDVVWRDCTPHQYIQSKQAHKELCKINSINVAQVEAITIVDEL